MQRSLALLAASLLLAAALLACSLPGSLTPAPASDSGDAVATSVAATLTALAPADRPGPTDTAEPTTAPQNSEAAPTTVPQPTAVPQNPEIVNTPVP